MKRTEPAMPARRPSPRQGLERGAVLIVSLVLLAVMLVLGLASMRLVVNEERMAGQTYDRALAFQAAEAALREAEAGVEAVKPTPPGPACSTTSVGTVNVLACPPPAGSATPRWQSIQAAEWATASPVTSGAITVTPKILVEYLGNTFPCGSGPSDPAVCKRYRITARAGEGDGRAAVLVQSVYATD